MKKHINKKGFGLVECVIALLLFTVITGSVLSVFTASRNQIRKQNERHKLDIMAGNILADFEGSKDYESFAAKLRDLKINVDAAFDDGGVHETLGLEGETTGSYGFDVNNVPTAVSFKKITVKKETDGKQYAVIKGGNDQNLVVFEGTYPKNELQANGKFPEFKADDIYNKQANITVSGKTKIYQNQILNKPTGWYEFTWTLTEDQASLTYKSSDGTAKKDTKSTCSFDKYLLKHGYYLKPIKKSYDFSTFGTTYDYFYFQVMNAYDNTPVKNSDQKCLYYKLTVASNDDVGNYKSSVNDFLNGNASDTYVDFDKINYVHEEGFIIKTKYGEISSCWADDNNTPESGYSVLTDDNGNYFTGKWYFYPWLVSNIAKDGIGEGSLNMTDSHYTVSKTDLYHDYVAKDGIKSDMYYALVKGDRILLFNADTELIFVYEGNTESPLNNLKNNCEYKNWSDGVYFDTVYKKWYKQGAVAKKDIKKVKFTDNPAGISKIEFFSTDNKPYIIFNYPAGKHDAFLEDKNSVLQLNGSYSDKYKYSLVYTKAQSNITDSSVIDAWKNVGDIKTKLAKTSTGTKTICRYAIMDKLGTINYCNYYKYSVSLKSQSAVGKISSLETSLTVTRNGSGFEYSGTQKATADISKTASVDSISLSDLNNETKNLRRTWLANVPDADSREAVDKSKISSYSSATSQAIKDIAAQLAKEWAKSLSDETASATKTFNTCPGDFDTNNTDGWTLGTVPGEAEIYEVKALSNFTFDGSSCIVEVAADGGESSAIFTAHTDDFVIEGTSKSACTYSVVALDSAEVNARTYLITYSIKNDATTELVAMVTFSDYAGVSKISDKVAEPRIKIWLIPASAKPSDIQDIDTAAYDKYVYCAYRKG